MSNLTKFSEAIHNRGIAKSSKYEVFFPIPTVLADKGYTGEEAEFVHLLVEQVQLPEFVLDTYKVHDDGVGHHVVMDKAFSPISMTIICDSAMDTKKFFDDWIQGTMKDPSGVFRYKDDYVVEHMSISQLNEAGEVTHTVKLYDAYPKIVDDIFYSAASRDYNRFRVQMAYRTWEREST